MLILEENGKLLICSCFTHELHFVRYFLENNTLYLNFASPVNES